MNEIAEELQKKYEGRTAERIADAIRLRVTENDLGTPIFEIVTALLDRLAQELEETDFSVEEICHHTNIYLARAVNERRALQGG